MIAKRIQIEGRRVTIDPKALALIDAKLNHIQEHHPHPMGSIRIVVVGSTHHRNGELKVHVTVRIKKRTIVIKKKGEHIHPLVEHALDALDRRLAKEHRPPLHAAHHARGEISAIKHV